MKTRFEKLLSFLPERIARAAASAAGGAAVEELRLRTARPPQLVFANGDALAEGVVFTPDDAKELLERLCRHSVYSHGEELANGFITVDGGSRVGVCGRPVTEGGRVVRLTEITGFNMRVSYEAVGCAEAVMGLLTEGGSPVSTLIAAPPSGGKTTLLRDAARCFSYGVGARPVKVAVADERGELAGSIDGAPSFDLGPRTDVMELCPKAAAIPMLIRSMSPDLVITDEVGGGADAEALSEAARCGVRVIASAHASSGEELLARKDLKPILNCGAFTRVLLLKRSGSRLTVCPVAL
ncbi:MAG: stage III sporulation protein AA [Clostridia bacterium]|nr:stage III sporulation protein AA [Clostridia bacterium]